MAINVEDQLNSELKQNGCTFGKAATFSAGITTTTTTATSTQTISGQLLVTGVSAGTAATSTQAQINAPLILHATKAAVNSTATLTSAQVALGYITSTSAAAVTMTMPTGTLLGGVLGASQGFVHELYIDNTAGANTVTIAVGVNGILSDAAATTAGSFGQLTVASGVTGLARFTLMFSSATAYVFTRTA